MALYRCGSGSSGGGGQWFYQGYQGSNVDFYGATEFNASDNYLFRLTASGGGYSVVIVIQIVDGVVTVIENSHSTYLTNISYSNGKLSINNSLTAGIRNATTIYALGY